MATRKLGDVKSTGWWACRTTIKLKAEGLDAVETRRHAVGAGCRRSWIPSKKRYELVLADERNKTTSTMDDQVRKETLRRQTTSGTQAGRVKAQASRRVVEGRRALKEVGRRGEHFPRTRPARLVNTSRVRKRKERERELVRGAARARVSQK
jgi:hypothetical protein